jgi:hypothetical protein
MIWFCHSVGAKNDSFPEYTPPTNINYRKPTAKISGNLIVGYEKEGTIMRTQEEILADLEEAKKEFERAEAEFTDSNRGEIDPAQEVALNPKEELILARKRLDTVRDRMEELRNEYDFFLDHQSGAQGGDEPI